jgi:DNA replication protein DnaC
MSRPVVAAELIRTHARTLKMPGLARTFEALARQAREERWTVEEYLEETLSAEVASRTASAVRQRLQAARFPELKPLDTFDFAAAEGLDAAVLLELARGEWIPRAENVLLVGPIGTGKTHLGIALGIEAARQRRHVAFWRAGDLVRTLLEARDARELTRLQRRLQRVELLILDELGFIPFDRAGGELLFNLLTARYERRAVLVTSNLAFSEWPQIFAGDEKLTTALLDRLAERATVITTRGRSFRLRRRRGREPAPANASTEARRTESPAEPRTGGEG